ncbi:MAG: 6-phosphofructokinase [Verrucomicrobia bacterium]|nr:6-phosphofructokinase [Verrucomicrobiota bacterium]
MSRIGVLTSGGDAPGMNAAVRAVVRTAHHFALEVFGIRRGYEGMMRNEIEPLGRRSVSNIIQEGGTVLKTSRAPRFLTPEGRRFAYENLRAHGIEGLVCIGGDGSFRGAIDLANEYDMRIVGVPGTIDNDLYGTDFTIGYDTAVNTALDAIDRIRDTAQSHDRMFIIEVMGRHAGFIGLSSGIGGGAEEIAIPETTTDVDEICMRVRQRAVAGKTSLIMVVAEGDETGGAIHLGERIRQASGIDFRVCILGHMQRGGRPTGSDRLLASRLGYEAVRALMAGKAGVMVGEVNGGIICTPLKEAVTQKKPVNPELVEMAAILSE